MNATLKMVYEASRNGCNHYIRHPLSPSFIYTDGVKEAADVAGAYWLLDILATEAPGAMRGDQNANNGALVVFTIKVNDSNNAHLSMSSDDDSPDFWKKYIGYTSFPEGEWKLYLQYDGSHVVCILPSEY